MDEEVWKPVTGDFTQPYEVSSLGRVRNAKTGRILAQHSAHNGYLCAALRTLDGSRASRVHVLVATEFIGLPGVGQEVNHKNGIKTDNRPENLEWVSHAENIRHYWEQTLGRVIATPVWAPPGFREGMSRICRSGEDNGNARLKRGQVEEIRVRLASGESQSELAPQYGVSCKTINHIATGRRWKLQT